LLQQDIRSCLQLLERCSSLLLQLRSLPLLAVRVLLLFQQQLLVAEPPPVGCRSSRITNSAAATVCPWLGLDSTYIVAAAAATSLGESLCSTAGLTILWSHL
jgi:hypothetical protein